MNIRVLPYLDFKNYPNLRTYLNELSRICQSRHFDPQNLTEGLPLKSCKVPEFGIILLDLMESRGGKFFWLWSPGMSVHGQSYFELEKRGEAIGLFPSLILDSVCCLDPFTIKKKSVQDHLDQDFSDTERLLYEHQRDTQAEITLRRNP